MPAGRPRKYNTPDEMEKEIKEYFDMCDNAVKEVVTNKGVQTIFKPYTISGLCIYLGITRETLSEYQNKEEFSDTIKRAKDRIENFVEEHSITGELNPVVSIFNLKNNFGWKDKQEVESINHNINTDLHDLSDDELQAELDKLSGK